MKDQTGTGTKKPVGMLKKSLKLDFKEFAKAATKGVIHVSTGQWDSAGEDGIDLASSVGLATTPSETAWLLIYRSIVQALKELINESFATEDVEYFFDGLVDQVNKALEEKSVTVNKKFFERPEAEPCLNAVKAALIKWLLERDIEKSRAESISDRLPAYFAMALHNEWARAPQEYAVLKEDIDTPFTKASERLQRWALYKTSLLKQVEEPMFNESFSLKRVFVYPRAFYVKKFERVSSEAGKRVASSEPVNSVVDLREYLDAWLERVEADDAIRLLSGGPGSGKSSFAKMYAADLARRSDIDVLFVPLHHFEPSADLLEAVGKFIQNDGILLNNPLAPEYRDRRLVLIFDGLDELALQGRVAERIAQDFVREVQRKVGQLNQKKSWLCVIISGRELVVQQSESDFRKVGQILHLLPYFVYEQERHSYSDPSQLLEIDQRDIWWANYGAATGQPYYTLPDELNQPHLVEITSQPLLNYLVALSLKRGELEFTNETNLNAVYADLLKAIYERGWSKQQHLAIQGIEDADFERILEEIALAAWHGDGRKTTVRDIATHCDNSGLQVLLERFQSGLQKGSTAKVTQLLTAFYFRQSGQDAIGEKTFEFTHKSFGEYLAARRIVREMDLISDQLRTRQRKPDLGWNERDCLRRWLTLCGSAAIDQYLFGFVVDELRLIDQRDHELVAEYQEIFCRLFAYMLQNGMPAVTNDQLGNFKIICEKSRRAEEALLICLNACAQVTRKISNISWHNNYVFADWLAKAGGRDFQLRPTLLMSCLSYLNLKNCNLTSQFLYKCDLSYSNLDNARLVGSDLRYSKMLGASMKKSHLAFTNLIGTSFEKGDLDGANFEGARVMRSGKILAARMRDRTASTSFVSASLEKADFMGCDLRYVDFSGANLRHAVFKYANLNGADFSRAELEGAEFKMALLDNAVFSSDRPIVIQEDDSEEEDENFERFDLDDEVEE